MADLLDPVTTLPLAVSLPSALTLLFLSYLVSTYTEWGYKLKYLRLVLGIPSCALWYACSFPDVEWPARKYYAAYLFLPMIASKKMLDVCFIQLTDREQAIPHWVELRWKDEDGKALDIPQRISLPLPVLFMDRVGYAFDSLCSVRGGSFYNDRVFDWAPRYIYEYRSTLTRWKFFRTRIIGVIFSMLAYDTIETILTAKKWDFLRADPLTSLPWPQQLFYGLLIGLTAIFATFFPYDLFVAILVPLFNGTQDKWPPMFNEVFKSSSLQELWAIRWHGTFARVWFRMSIPFVEPLRPYISIRILRFIRAVVIFGFSFAYHNLMLNGMKPDVQFYRSNFNVPAFKLFMSQPLGLFFESQVVNPFTEQLPGKQKRWIRKLFMFAWLIWTFRWYGDYQLHFGLFVEKAYDPSLSLYVFRTLGLDDREDSFVRTSA